MTLTYLQCVGLVAVLLAGCTVAGDESSTGSGAAAGNSGRETGDVAIGGAGGDDASSEATSTSPPAVEGTWAQILHYASINDIPTVGQTNGSTDTLQRVTIERTGTSLTLQVEPCAIDIDNGTPLVSTIVPNAFLHSLGITSRSGSLIAEAGRWHYVQDENLQLRGVKLDNPQQDALPTTADDPRVWDQDGDGLPGVTVRVTGITDGEVYVVQRDKHRVDAVVDGDRFVGLVDWSVEQFVLGSDNPILNMQTGSVKDPETAASYFVARRIDETKTCEDIVNEREELFGR